MEASDMELVRAYARDNSEQAFGALVLLLLLRPRLRGRTRSEWATIGTLGAVIATMMFCAKEASYKAWAMKGALSFRQIHIAPQADGFTATHAGQSLQGRYAVEGDLMLTAAWF